MKKVLLTMLIGISACICMLILSCASTGELFYYGTTETEKVMLSVPGNKIIVKYAPEVESEYVLRKLEKFGKAEKVYEQIFIITLQDPKSLDESLETLKEENDVISANPIYLTSDKQEMGVTDEICLEFNDEVQDNEKMELLNNFNAVEVSRTQPWEEYFTIISVGKDQNALEVANRIKESGLVKFAHPNFYAMTYKHSFFPNDEFFPRQFYLHNTGQATNDGHFGTPDADIDAPEAWDITRGVNTITIAVIDEGVERNNNDLSAARLTILNGSNFASGNLNDPDAAGDGAHGTCCAGIIAAEQNNIQGISGIAPLCRIMPVRVPFGIVPSSIYADAINFAWSSGADVLSNSWGYSSTADIPDITAAINNAITMGRNGTGSVVVWSAGNTANHNIGNAGFVSYPGCVVVANVITVGASDRNDQQANYSPTGAEVDVVAPSHRAYSCQIAGESFEVWSTDIIGAAGYNSTKNTDCGALPVVGDNLPSAGTNFQDYTGRMGGTSAACPEVAGVAALILSIHPTYTPAQVFSNITNNADKVGGYTYVGGRCDEMGFGRLNAFNALSVEVPEKAFFFSTEEDFITFSEKLIQENYKIISDGDLLNAAGTVYKTNYELLGKFWAGFDLGLDAADVIDKEDGLVAFSTELDDPKGRFTAGDLLTTWGAILPNSALLDAFDIPDELDLGLDALHFTGEKDAIIKFLEIVKEEGRKFWLENPKALIEYLEKYGVDIWFSTEGTPPLLSPEKPRFLDGDLLSAAKGIIVIPNSKLLPPSVPAGIPERGVDFGLDAVTLDKEKNIEFSTEILYENKLSFTDGDVLLQDDGVTIQNIELIKPFEPKVEELGLDALSFYFY
jgi:subtilisin family serine protease